MKIIIRSDASNEPNFGTNLGTGHLLRMNMLGQHLKKSAKVNNFLLELKKILMYQKKFFPQKIL